MTSSSSLCLTTSSFTLSRGRVTSLLGSALGPMFVAGLLLGAMPGRAAAAETETPAAKEPVSAAAAQKPTAEQQETWRQSILKIPRPNNTGCFTAKYPDTQWSEVPCAKPPHKLFLPRRPGASPLQQVGGVVGGVSGPDFSAAVEPRFLSKSESGFDAATVAGPECSAPCDTTTDTCPANLTCTTPGAVADAYSLQLNTKPFQTVECKNSPNPNPPGSPDNPLACHGWEQFVYEGGGGGFIQYWLTNYGPPGATCPAPISASCQNGVADGPQTDGWCPVPIYGGTDCVVNGPAAVPAPAAAPTSASLSGMKIEGTVSNATVYDSITVTVGGQPYTKSGGKYFSDMDKKWDESEFNVFGDGGGSQAVFGSGTTLRVRVGADSGVTTGPGCDDTSFTGESNNLTLGNTPPSNVMPGPMPALVFTESFPAPAGSPATCADAVSVGDTHLTTFDGLKYDFQATGDFLLAQSGDFTVQTRQALSVTNPNWIKNAALNKAVAVQMGKTKVALYIWPVRLVVDGKTTALAEGKTITLSSGVDIALRSGVYIIASPTGGVVFVTANNNNINTWLDIRVGLGHTPAPDARGLLGNPGGNATELKTADGSILRTVSFPDLYQRYAESWRLQPNQSMLEADPKVTAGVPDKPFYASDLDAQSAEHARAICTAAGVTNPALLDDCILDTAVLGGNEDTAARVYTRVIVPRVVLPHLALH